MRRYALYGAALIGLYIAVANWKGFSADESASASGGASLVKAFQGR
jgi:hypothetical protein